MLNKLAPKFTAAQKKTLQQVKERANYLANKNNHTLIWHTSYSAPSSDYSRNIRYVDASCRCGRVSVVVHTESEGRIVKKSGLDEPCTNPESV